MLARLVNGLEILMDASKQTPSSISAVSTEPGEWVHRESTVIVDDILEEWRSIEDTSSSGCLSNEPPPEYSTLDTDITINNDHPPQIWPDDVFMARRDLEERIASRFSDEPEHPPPPYSVESI